MESGGNGHSRPFFSDGRICFSVFRGENTGCVRIRGGVCVLPFEALYLRGDFPFRRLGKGREFSWKIMNMGADKLLCNIMKK